MHMNTDLSDRRSLSLLLIGGGILLLAFWQFGIGIVWPIFIIGPGAVMLYHALNAKTNDDIDMIFPGLIVTATGLLLFYQSVTGAWHSWSYAWAMYPALTGYAMQWRAARLEKYEDEYETGQNLFRYGLIALIGLAVVFEFAIFNTGSAGLVGLALIGAGIYFLRNNSSDEPVSFSTLIKPKNDKRKFDEDAA